MDATTRSKTAELVPSALKGAPALIERAFPATKVSFEAQKERKANLGQTLTGLGSYWKGRKPLILVRAIVLGCLLPQTEDAEADLALFEALMGFDIDGLARRAVTQNALKPKDLAGMVHLDHPWKYFNFTIKKGASITEDEVKALSFPVDADALGVTIQWKRGLNNDSKAFVYAKALEVLTSYEERASLCKRPEEVDQAWLYAPAWRKVNVHLADLGINAHSFDELIAQLGLLRYGKRPRVGDTFSGGGSIPFEAARLGCDVYASDLNPVASMLTWGALNIIGAAPEKREEIEKAQEEVANAVDEEIISLGIEHDSQGNRAKVYLYCLEVKCPETGWMVPMLPSRVISKTRNVVATLIPNHINKRFDIEISSGASKEELTEAEKGTVQNGSLVYELEGNIYRTAIKTLRGDYKDSEGHNRNLLRHWEKGDFKPRKDDIFQDRLYAIQWIQADTLDRSRPHTFFRSVTDEDLEREHEVEALVASNLSQWQRDGLVPDMQIEHGAETTRLYRERGWTHWHHLFSPRQIILNGLIRREIAKKQYAPHLSVIFGRCIDANSKLCRWDSAQGQDRVANTFSNQALNTVYNYPVRGMSHLSPQVTYLTGNIDLPGGTLECAQRPANLINQELDLFITDPPYADAVNYHEITEFFISWLRKNPPAPFNEWTWDSRRSLAIKGSDDGFRRGMVDAYKAMADHMPENGMQCVMFTHQDTSVWSDMVGIFWAAGLQVTGAWYIATETTSELKKGGYVQGTVILMLRKRPEGDRKGFTRRIYPAVHKEVESQIEEMLHLNQQVEDHTGEPVFNDADLQMAGYAAALKILTAYTEIGGEDVTAFALRPRQKGEKTVVDDIVQQASETANSLLVPDGLKRDTWQSINGIQRFYLRLLDIETTGASKLDNYQNFAKAFRVEDYTRVMASTAANSAKLKQVEEMTSRDLMDTTELGATHLGHLMVAIQQLLNDVDIKVVVSQLVSDLPDYFERRGELIDMTRFLALKATNEDVRHWAEVLGDRIANEQLA
ncbi:anti-phage-associated DUF1156 domain-containing protein [Marinobacter sp.]|uniref:anti-phage-associated DUF1156 domain-containing protein n=1 Tax=Marinobacter sp. TaxID=50741 RepID=UPI000C4CE06F|nr:anti-phage-associated DUF1156 domain-containing protein [Marinobacter sp.]MBE93924.1 DNA methylase [Marinobacter sp.]|tara:strand:+ start:376 stop:3420 length:3045 start_codon:yes stop_codon:yes gene_type:complete